DQENTTISALRPNEKLLVNGKDFNNDQPVKISRIELVENKLNASLPPEPRSTSQQLQHNSLQSNPREKENHECAQSSIVTADYIQQTIQNALRQGNLNPEIEEKLLNLQRCHEKQMKATSIVLANNHHEYTSHMRSPSYRKHPLNRQMEDDEDWIMETPKRRPPRTLSEKKITQNSSVCESDVNRIIRSVAEEASSSEVIKSPVFSDKQSTTRPTECAVVTETMKGNTNDANVISQTNEIGQTKRSVTIKRDNEKKKQMQMKLYRQKEQLKKDILKKRIVLEKELQNEIQKELASELASQKKEVLNESHKPDKANNISDNVVNFSKKRVSIASSKKSASEETQNVQTKNITNEMPRKPIGHNSSKQKRRSQKFSSLTKKKKKLYCICRTPYDDSK
ncbi:nucleosome-remodeling factor subunit NURF301-like, partial [Sitodiplosis mosellana]|uniref:nucleosome-remodeling factor subunit NURF301-like n=1 Tax=Sitodiplosis mosellana TaxID=263140 RepID=UPI0024445BE9